MSTELRSGIASRTSEVPPPPLQFCTGSPAPWCLVASTRVYTRADMTKPLSLFEYRSNWPLYPLLGISAARCLWNRYIQQKTGIYNGHWARVDTVEGLAALSRYLARSAAYCLCDRRIRQHLGDMSAHNGYFAGCNSRVNELPYLAMKPAHTSDLLVIKLLTPGACPVGRAPGLGVAA